MPLGDCGKPLETLQFLNLARLLLCKGHRDLPTEFEQCKRRKIQVALSPAVPHHFGRVRSDRRGFRLQSRAPARPFAASVLISPTWAIGAYLRSALVVLAVAPAVPEGEARPQVETIDDRAGRPANEQRELAQRGLTVNRLAAGCGARFEKIEQSRGAGAAAARRRRRARARWPESSARTVDDLDHRASSGSDGAGHSMPDARRGAVEQPADRPPVADQAVAAPSAQPLRSEIASVSSAWRAATRLDFGLRRAGRARQRADGGGQADEIEPLALERFGCPRQPMPAPRRSGSAEARFRSGPG